MPDLQIYDVFCGRNVRDCIWVCCAEGLQNAKLEMEKLAAKTPGPYFVYYTPDQSIVARIDTLKKTKASTA